MAFRVRFADLLLQLATSLRVHIKRINTPPRPLLIQELDLRETKAEFLMMRPDIHQLWRKILGEVGLSQNHAPQFLTKYLERNFQYLWRRKESPNNIVTCSKVKSLSAFCDEMAADMN